MKLYRKAYLCVCEGQQEELYLKHCASLLTRFPEQEVTFNTILGDANKLLKNYTEYDSAVLFNYDFDETRFRNNIEICDKLNKMYKPTKRKSGKNIYHSYSNVNFDLWLILHKEDYNRSVSRNDAYVSEVRRIYGLDSDADIKNKDIIDKILVQISIEDIKNAITRADNIRDRKLDSDKRVIGSSICYTNPDFSINNFLKIVLTDCRE